MQLQLTPTACVAFALRWQLDAKQRDWQVANALLA